MRSVSVRITGMVQGVGFRPFVAEQAQELHLSGWVKNSGGIVIVRLTGSEKAVNEWFYRLYHFTPKGARIDQVEVSEEAAEEVPGEPFSIISSTREDEELRFLPPDLTICDICAKELLNPADRRYRHPFISCTSCGPRYSILKDVPYDREHITMDKFAMCGECLTEYTKRGNRRRHAQTIACHNCGPVLRAETEDGEYREGEKAIQIAVSFLKQEKVIAIKDIGGYHFACCAGSERAVLALRSFKNRDAKPFAVMFPDIESVCGYCEVSEKERELLLSGERPIVLLSKKNDFLPVVCGSSNRIGAMLPCNPVQILLIKETGPLVMTSGNRGGEPILISDEAMLSYFDRGFPSLVLYHDREILEPLEDSIYQVNEKGSVVQLIRRARGLVPEPVRMNRSLPEQCLAAGGDLKSVFALGKKNIAYLSSSFGDLIHNEAETKRVDAVKRMEDLFVIKPKIMVADMHPLYRSSQYRADTEKIIYVQHHHAHIASVMAEYGLSGQVLGIAFDGTGYGTDQTIWGGEFLLCERNQFERRCSLVPIAMPGSDRTAEDAWVPALCYLDEALKRGLITEESIQKNCGEKNWKQFRILHAARENRIGQTESSSMGRLFDAVAAILGVCEQNSYEGQCPSALESAAEQYQKDMALADEKKSNDSLQINIGESHPGYLYFDSPRLIRDIFLAKNRGESVGYLAYAFHRSLADATIEVCERICGNKIRQIALAGGTWYNKILLELVMDGLSQRGYSVFVNQKVPSGDGGLALGQLWLATFV